jgi:hypothetical protein
MHTHIHTHIHTHTGLASCLLCCLAVTGAAALGASEEVLQECY